MALGHDPSVRPTTLLLNCGPVAVVVLVTAILWASAMTPGYNHMANTISQLAAQGQPHPEIMSAGFILFGLLMDAFALGLYRALRDGKDSLAALLGLLVFGTSVFITGLAQDYNLSPDVPHNLEGHIHNVFALVSVFALLAGLLSFARATYRRPGWRAASRLSLATVVVLAALGMLFSLLPASVLGLVQRAVFLITLSWVLMTSTVARRNLRAS